MHRGLTALKVYNRCLTDVGQDLSIFIVLTAAINIQHMLVNRSPRSVLPTSVIIIIANMRPLLDMGLFH